MAKSGSESPKKSKKKRDDPVSVTSSGSMGEVFESIASVQQSLAHLLSQVIPELSDARAQQQKTNQQLTDGLNALKSLVSNLPSGSMSTTTTTTDSTVTNPFELDIDLGTKTGVSIYNKCLDTDLSGIVVNDDTRVQLMRLLRDLKTNKGFGKMFQIPIKGTGKPAPKPDTLPNGAEIATVDFKECLDLLDYFSKLTKDQFMAFVCWIHGEVDCELKSTSNRTQKVLPLQATGNKGLVARMKHQLRIKSDLLQHLLRKILSQATMDSFIADKESLVWTKEGYNTQFYCGFSILWNILEVIEPKTKIEAVEFEDKIRNTTLDPDCSNDVREYCQTLLGYWDTLRERKPDTMSEDTFTQILFDGLLKSTNDNFRNFVQNEQNIYHTEDGAQFDVRKLIAKVEKLYRSMVQRNTWPEGSKDDPAVVALVSQNKLLKTQLKSAKKELKQQNKGHSAGGGGGGTGFKDSSGRIVAGPKHSKAHHIELWRTQQKGDFITNNGKLYQWCPLHVEPTYFPKGLYMFCNSRDGKTHDHEAWQTLKDNRKKAAKKRRQRATDDSEKEAKKSKAGLRVRRSEKETRVHSMVTELVKTGLDHHQAAVFATKHYGSDSVDDSSDEESKE